MVTAGCAAALTNATAACIAGADPEKMQRLPYLSGLKNEVIMPRSSRNVYDHAVRMLGVRIVEVDTREQFVAALSEKTAMVCVLAGPSDKFLEQIAAPARERGVPILVDAAAEHLTIPNVHLQRGATMAAYSGGKCIRRPQCAGLLLGPKDLLQAAWLNSAPHHAFGRSLKVGKEEIMGMLAAVEMLTKRDHDAERKTWESWLAHIAGRASKVPTVQTQVLQPEGLSNRSPRLRISWDAAKVGINGAQLEKVLYEGEPRIILGGSSGGGRRAPGGESSITIMPYMMIPGDEKVAAERILAVLSKPPRQEPEPAPGAPTSVAGQWDLQVQFVRGAADHGLFLEQEGANLTGTHKGDLLAGDGLDGIEPAAVEKP